MGVRFISGWLASLALGLGALAAVVGESPNPIWGIALLLASFLSAHWGRGVQAKAPPGAKLPAPPAPPAAAAAPKPKANPEEPLGTAQINRLAGLCEGILADDEVSQAEVEYLRTWLKGDPRHQQDRRTRPIFEAVKASLVDAVVSPHEAMELRALLSDFCDRVLDAERPLPRPQPRNLEQPADHLRPAKPQDGQPRLYSEIMAEAASKPRAATAKPHAGPAPLKPKRRIKSGVRAGATFLISYQSASGEISEREIDFRSCTAKGGTYYLNAHCLTRQAFRTFRLDRILSAVDTRTGEWIEDPEAYFSGLAA